MHMHSLPEHYKALVIGASGAIGAAFVDLLNADPRCALVLGFHRQSQPKIDFANETSIVDAASVLAGQGPFHLIINATGILHAAQFMPEKKLGDLHYEQMLATFQINTFGPAMVMRHFSKLLAKDKAVMAILSAKVGSIEDNRLGGWYSYRASKTALNMLIKTAAIEIKRTQPNTTMIALHPGTVNSSLSQPFRGAEIGRPAHDAASDMLKVLDSLTSNDSGEFYSYTGEKLPW